MFPEEDAKVDIRCKKKATLLILTVNELNDFASLHKSVRSKMLRFQNKLFKKEKHYMLDYIPGSRKFCQLKKYAAVRSPAQSRKQLLQNVVM